MIIYCPSCNAQVEHHITASLVICNVCGMARSVNNVDRHIAYAIACAESNMVNEWSEIASRRLDEHLECGGEVG